MKISAKIINALADEQETFSKVFKFSAKEDEKIRFLMAFHLLSKRLSTAFLPNLTLKL